MPRFIIVNRYFHPDESATSQFLTDLAQHLAGRHEVLALASRQMLEDRKARLPAEGVLGSVQVRRLWSTAWGRSWLPGRLLDYLSFLLAVGLWLLLSARRGDRVLAKTDPPLLGLVTSLATLGRGVKRIQWLQDLYPETAVKLGVVGEAGFVAMLVRRLRNWSLRRSALVVTVSAGMLEHLRGSVGQTALVHIPNWADDHTLTPDPSPSRERGTGLVVGYSGNLGRAHPIDGLLQLAEVATDPSLQFLISGGGANHERLRERVQGLRRTNWQFLPYQPRMHVGELLLRSDLHIVILDPRVERFIFPSKVYGILSAGRPILHLGDPDGEVAQLVREYRCGWSLPAHEGAPILALLHKLRADRALLREAGRNARLAYEREGSRERALQRWDEVLERV